MSVTSTVFVPDRLGLGILESPFTYSNLYNLLSVLVCFSNPHGCREGYLNYHSLPVSLKQSGQFPLTSLIKAFPHWMFLVFHTILRKH